jgi:hypothetical protein
MRLSTLTGAFCIGAATAVQATLPCSSVSCLPHDGPVPSIGPGIAPACRWRGVVRHEARQELATVLTSFRVRGAVYHLRACALAAQSSQAAP